MAPTAVIPRFLLPRGEALLFRTRSRPFTAFLLFQQASLPQQRLRQASTTKTSPKPIPKPAPHILAKPEKFTPPSHPSRIVKATPIRQYGPAITTEEKETHATKQYPHMPPPKGSFMDRFLHSRPVHTIIALGVLIFFAAWTFILNFKATSPYAGQIPSFSDWKYHPLRSFSQFFNVLRMHEIHESEKMQEKRDRAVAETMKTKAYRVMHGLEPLKGQPTEVIVLVAKMRGEYIDGKSDEAIVAEIQEPPPKRPIKKWLGIW